MEKLKVWFLLCLILVSFTVNAQKEVMKVGTNPTTIQPSAVLEIESTTKGFLLPRLTSAERKAIVTPVSGLMVYDITLKGTYIYDGTKWDSANIPAGSVNYFANNTVPNGYLECNGQAVSRSTYAELFAAIGTVYGVGNGSSTFNLPDLRGEFIRGWDNGRGIDLSRHIGTWQVATAFLGDGGGGDGLGLNSTHSAKLNTAINQTVLGFEPDTEPAVPTTISLYSPVNLNSVITANGMQVSGGASGYSDFARTRPRNVAMLSCIKF